MNRRLSLVVAGATAAVVTASGAAVAANYGILGTDPASWQVGTLDARTLESLAPASPVTSPASVAPQPAEIEVVVEDPPSAQPAVDSTAPAAPPVQPLPTWPAPVPTAVAGGAGATSPPPASVPAVTAPPVVSPPPVTAPSTDGGDDHPSSAEPREDRRGEKTEAPERENDD